jgi:hypothetical protein
MARIGTLQVAVGERHEILMSDKPERWVRRKWCRFKRSSPALRSTAPAGRLDRSAVNYFDRCDFLGSSLSGNKARAEALNVMPARVRVGCASHPAREPQHERSQSQPSPGACRQSSSENGQRVSHIAAQHSRQTPIGVSIKSLKNIAKQSHEIISAAGLTSQPESHSY